MTKKTTDSNDEPKDTPSAPTVFDVSKPGETAADPTSRPVIVGHTSTLNQDPMVSSNKKDNDENLDKAKTLTKKPELNVKPPEEEKTENSEPTPSTESSETTENNEKPEEENSDSGAIDVIADEASNKKVSKKELEEEKAQQENLQELINTKKYFLPIREGGKKRSGEIAFVWFVILLVLFAAGAWFLVDAGYFDPGFELPYDLIQD